MCQPQDWNDGVSYIQIVCNLNAEIIANKNKQHFEAHITNLHFIYKHMINVTRITYCQKQPLFDTVFDNVFGFTVSTVQVTLL